MFNRYLRFLDFRFPYWEYGFARRGKTVSKYRSEREPLETVTRAPPYGNKEWRRLEA